MFSGFRISLHAAGIAEWVAPSAAEDSAIRDRCIGRAGKLQKEPYLLR